MLKLGTVTPTRCLVVLVAASCVLFFALVPRYDLFEEQNSVKVLVPRAGIFPGFGDTTSSTTTTAAATTTSDPTTSTSATSTTTTSIAPSTSTSTTSTSTSQTTQSTSPTTTSTSTTQTTAATTSPPSQNTQTSTSGTAVTTAVVSTGDDGEVQTVIITSTPVPTSSTSSAPDNTGDSGGSSNKTSTIIGLSVAGGVALIGLVSFFVWKFTRKRFGDEFDDGEAIKWPELNNHGTSALPTTAADRGLGTGSPGEISRAPSRMNEGYAASVAASSTADLYAPQDPYAVPPLPHMNPNQPYRDDPGAYGTPGYYDPYRGPVPQTFNDTAPEHGAGGEAIPMTQLAPAARARSPAPALAYDMTGRASPQPSMMAQPPMMGRASPAPAYAYGRASPAPNVGLGLGAAAAAGRQSPGPQIAYDMGPR